jgi:hypothetical protein
MADQILWSSTLPQFTALSKKRVRHPQSSRQTTQIYLCSGRLPDHSQRKPVEMHKMDRLRHNQIAHHGEKNQYIDAGVSFPQTARVIIDFHSRYASLQRAATPP